MRLREITELLLIVNLLTNQSGSPLSLLSIGYMASGASRDRGGSSEYLCLVENPAWGRYDAKENDYASIHMTIFKAGAQLFSDTNTKNIINQAVPCAVCQTGRTVQVNGHLLQVLPPRKGGGGAENVLLLAMLKVGGGAQQLFFLGSLYVVA